MRYVNQDNQSYPFNVGVIVDDYDKYNPLAPSKVKGFLFAYFLDL